MSENVSKARRSPSFYRAAGAILLALLVVSGVTAGYFARMRFGGGGSVDSRAASFDITEEGIYSTAFDCEPITPGMSVSKTLTVTNNSETAMDCTLKLVNSTENLPLVFSVRYGGTVVPGTQTGSVSTQTIRLAPGSGSAEFEIIMEWPAAEDSEARSGMVDYVKVTLEAIQAQ